MKSKKILMSVLLFAVCWTQSLSAVDLTQDFNFDGYLTDSSNVPLSGAQTLIFQIYDPSVACLLYEETQNITITSTDGSFSTKVGTGTRVGAGVDGGGSLKNIFQNDSQARASGTNCAGGYTPTTGAGRKLRVTVGGVVLSPDYSISAVPMATVAESLQGKVAADFMPANTNYTLPLTDGTTNQILQTNGAGNVSWSTPAVSAVSSVEGAVGAIDLITSVVSGVDAGPTLSQAGSNVTLNIPRASNANTTTGGLISNAEYSSLNSKMNSTLSNGNIFVGSAGNVATGVPMSGDASISNVGALTISSGAINSAKILDGSVSTADIANASITPAKISGGFPFINISGGTMTGNLGFTPGTVTNPGLHLNGDVNTGITSSAAANLEIVTGGTMRMKFDPGGNVGIGTASPSEALDVIGQIKAQNIIVMTGGAPGAGCSIAGQIGYHGASTQHVFCDGTTWKGMSASPTPAAGSASTASFGSSKTVVVTGPSASITLNNMVNGGEYKVVFQGVTVGTYNFTSGACGTWKWKTPNANTTVSTDTIYKIQVVNSTCYVDWASGYN